MEIVELHPNVLIYRGLFNNPEKLIDFFRETNEWNQWFVYGDMTTITESDHVFQNFPTKDHWDSTIVQKDSSNSETTEILNVFYEATSHYKENFFKDETPNWKFTAPAICMYKTDGGADTNVGLFYHTDFQQERADAPGPKPVITCTMYLNDDYEGGEICFKILNEEGNAIETYFEHKPKAGDILVFPSRSPYYHGVNKTTKGQKYFVRSFWQYQYAGAQEWLDNQEKYGHEKWAEMEKERERLERNTGRYNLRGIDY
jgi:predicted 2-oxoglutarate/Fe(II)-dependent dioxygenase YbiX